MWEVYESRAQFTGEVAQTYMAERYLDNVRYRLAVQLKLLCRVGRVPVHVRVVRELGCVRTLVSAWCVKDRSGRSSSAFDALCMRFLVISLFVFVCFREWFELYWGLRITIL